MATIYFETVEIGDPIPSLQKPPITRTQIAKYAAASGDYGPLHVDEEVARASGYGSVFAHGMIAMAYVGEMMERWLGNGRVAHINVRFMKIIWPGDVLSAKGVVVRKSHEDKSHRIDCDVWVQNQNHDIVLRGQAFCVVYQNAQEEKSHGKGRPDPVQLKNLELAPAVKKPDQPKPQVGVADKPPPRPPAQAKGTPAAALGLATKAP
ncbi:MAG: MaoC/PaaZ C-terminal domain-containing protein, partial [Myxococcota bacterium]